MLHHRWQLALVGLAGLASACGGKTDENDGDRADLVLNQSEPPGDSATADPAAGATPQDDADLQGGGGLPDSADSQGSAELQASAQSNAESQSSATAPTATELFRLDEAPSAETEGEDEVPEDPVTIDVPVEQIVAEACRIWLDGPESPLTDKDVSVEFGGQAWPPTTSCAGIPGFLLENDTEGLWLSLCPSACDEVTRVGEGTLRIEANYWTATRQVRVR